MARSGLTACPRRSPRRDWSSTLLAILRARCLLACLCLPATAKDPLAAANYVSRQAVKFLASREAGARCGQASAVAIVCYGLKATQRVEELRAQYRVADLSEFDAEVARTLEAWKETATCRNAPGPNECKLSHVWSCQQALKEIGPEGTAVSGLVEPQLQTPREP
jgi:uncharacterized Ntn-hydrolase superfamily protein